MSNPNGRKVAALFAAIAASYLELEVLFRGDADEEGPAAGNAKAGKSVPATKSTPASKAKPSAKTAAEEEELDLDAVRAKLKELAEHKGKDAMVAALESVGAGKLSDVDESQYGELVEKITKLMDVEDEDEEEAPKKPAAKKAPAKGKKAGPTLEDVKAAAQALIDADKPAFLKLSKKLGKPSDMDEGDYAAAIEAYEAAMPEEADEGELL